jgi:hypothetical protein
VGSWLSSAQYERLVDEGEKSGLGGFENLVDEGTGSWSSWVFQAWRLLMSKLKTTILSIISSLRVWTLVVLRN